MGRMEKEHIPLRQIFWMLSGKHQSLSSVMFLKYAVKVLKDTAGEKGLVPSLLVFGVIPLVRNLNSNLHNQEELFKAMKDARVERDTITEERRIRRAMRSDVTPSAK